MTLSFAVIRENQNKLNQLLEQCKLKVNAENQISQIQLQANEELIESLKRRPRLPDWFYYQRQLTAFRLHIESLLRSLQDVTLSLEKHRAAKMTLQLLLLSLPELLNSSLSYLENKNPTLQGQALPSILYLQQKVDSALDFFISRREKAIPLDLSKLKEEYEEAYVTAHGCGCLGFFTLRIKRFFRQESRTEELKFIENINIYLKGEGGAALSGEAKEKLKLSALHLVHSKISNEAFGKTSLLKGVIEKRLEHVGLQDNKEILIDFINLCKERNIVVPEGLSSYYQNDIKMVSPI